MVIDPGPRPAPPSPQAAAIQRDNARVGYEVAASLMVFEGNLVWARYGLMLLAHTIILTAIGLTSNTSVPVKAVIFTGLSLVGLVLCLVWWMINDIGFRYFFYWLFAARELEERFLSPVTTLSRGVPVVEGEEVLVSVGGQTRRLPVYRKDRFNVVRGSRLIIIVVGALYLVLLVLSVVAGVSRLA